MAPAFGGKIGGYGGIDYGTSSKTDGRGGASIPGPGKLGDGDGRWLIAQAGRRAWYFRYMRVGKAPEMALGNADRISLNGMSMDARTACYGGMPISTRSFATVGHGLSNQNDRSSRVTVASGRSRRISANVRRAALRSPSRR